MRARNAAKTTEDKKALATKASRAAAIAMKGVVDPYKEKYGADRVKETLSVMNSAKGRCTNPNNLAYKNYGLRGISFDFISIRQAAEWVLDNLGPRPSTHFSIDRIDNNKGYCPGNLRWATREEQNRNKRAYKRGLAGERIRNLMSIRPDLSYESIRTYIKNGKLDEEIVNKRKYKHDVT